MFQRESVLSWRILSPEDETTCFDDKKDRPERLLPGLLATDDCCDGRMGLTDPCDEELGRAGYPVGKPVFKSEANFFFERPNRLRLERCRPDWCLCGAGSSLGEG